MNIRPLQQGTPEWHAWRQAGVTASEIAVLLGLSPWKTRWQLWAEKSGLRQPDTLDSNPHVRRGRRFEHLLRETVARARGIGLLPVCIEHPAHPVLRASLDGIDPRGRPWELKIPSAGNFESVRRDRLDSAQAQQYLPQIQQQMLCAGASEGWLVFGRLSDTGREARVVDHLALCVPADPTLWERIIEAATAFHEQVRTGRAPEKDPARDLFAPTSAEEARIWAEQADLLIPLLQRKAALEAELAQIRTRIADHAAPVKTILGPHKAGAFAGLRITRTTRQGGVDWRAYMAAKGDDPADAALLAPFRTKGACFHQLTVLRD